MLIQYVATRFLLIVASLWHLGPVLAAATELTVIFDNGQARPIADFLNSIRFDKPNKVSSYSDQQQLGRQRASVAAVTSAVAAASLSRLISPKKAPAVR